MISHLSISQGISKKRKSATIEETITTETTNQSTNETSNVVTHDDHQQEMNVQEENDEQLPIATIKNFKPKYLKVSDRVFKKMLSNAIHDGHQLVQCLDTNEKLQIVRQMTEITNNLHYFSLQQDLWQYHFNFGTKENIWTTDVTNSNTTQSNNDRTYYYPKHLIERRQKRITHQLQRTKNESEQGLIYLKQNTSQWQPPIDCDQLIQIITVCVEKGLQHLRHEFLYRAAISELDFHDRRATTHFYDIQPNEEQVCLK